MCFQKDSQTLSEPVFYGDLDYNFGKPTFSPQFKR